MISPTEDAHVRSRAFDRRTVARALGVSAGLVAYYSFDWIFLQQAWHEAFSLGLATIGHEVGSIGTPSAPVLLVDGRSFSLSRNCTYVDLVLVLAPLLWVPGRYLAANLRRVVTLTTTIAAFNLLRVTFAIHMNVAEGLAWEHVHFWPDCLFHFGVITWASVSALWADWHAVAADPVHAPSTPPSSPDYGWS